MAKKKNTCPQPKEITTEREKEVWALRQQSWTHERIAKHMKLSQPGVTKILKRMTDRYAAELMEDIKYVKADQVSQLERIADQAMQEWEKSKNPLTSASRKSPIGMDGKPSQVHGEYTKETKDQTGDPRYLTVAMKAKEDIRKIIGADAPLKTISLNKDVTQLTDQQLMDIVNGNTPTDF